MRIIIDRALIECPRCGLACCEQNGIDLLCPNCLFHEPITSTPRTRVRSYATPTDVAAPDPEDQIETVTLGEFIEQVPADLINWDLSLDSERILKMNAVQKTDNQEKPVTVFDVVIADEAKNGRTYWHNIGVAFPLTNGSNGLSLKLHMFPGVRIFVKESIRAVGAAKAAREVTPDEDTPF